MEDNSNFSVEEAGKRVIDYSRSTMVFVNQLNVIRCVVRNYVKLLFNRGLAKTYTPELLISKLEEFLGRVGCTN